MENIRVYELAYKKCNKTANNYSHPLTEYSIKSILHIWYMILFCSACDPEIGGRNMYSRVKHQESIANKSNCCKGNSPHGFWSVIFIYNISHYKLKWPKQYTAG